MSMLGVGVEISSGAGGSDGIGSVIKVPAMKRPRETRGPWDPRKKDLL